MVVETLNKGYLPVQVLPDSVLYSALTSLDGLGLSSRPMRLTYGVGTFVFVGERLPKGCISGTISADRSPYV